MDADVSCVVGPGGVWGWFECEVDADGCLFLVGGWDCDDVGGDEVVGVVSDFILGVWVGCRVWLTFGRAGRGGEFCS